MLLDGGKLDAQIAAELHRVEASKYQLLSLYNERALFLADIWVDLEKYYIKFKDHGEIRNMTRNTKA